MSKRAAPFLILGVVVAGATMGGGWWLTHRDIVSTDNAYVHADITTISPKVAGYVAAVPVQDNQAVAAGTVLVRLDDSDYRNRVAEADAAVAAAQAGLTALDSRLEAQDAAIQEAAAEIAISRAENLLATRDLDRIRRLAKDDFASRQSLDTADAAADKGRAEVTRAAAGHAAALGQAAVLRADRARLEALLAQAEAARDLARDALDHTVIRAPRAGVVGNRGVRPGQYVGPGSHLMALVPLDEVWIDANFKETQIGHLAPGQPVTIHVDAWPDTPLAGTVGSVAPASGAQFSLLPAENATGNFTKIVQRVPVRITLADGHPLAGRLRPGLSVVVDVDTGMTDAPSSGGALAQVK